MITFADIHEPWGDDAYPAIDTDTSIGAAWVNDGVVVLRGFTDDTLIDAYVDEWRAHAPGVGGFTDDCPYMRHDALRALCCDGDLADVLAQLVGEPAGVHLNLSGWRTTTRDWHPDQKLNPPGVGAYYAAVWFALDDIDPASGPFEYVPGSHRWDDVGPISQAKLRAALGDDGHGPNWPRHSERILTPLFEAELDARGITPVRFDAQRGDVLIWHPRLWHRGAPADDPDLERRALIAHYSGITHRPDMPAPVRHELGGWYFPIRTGS